MHPASQRQCVNVYALVELSHQHSHGQDTDYITNHTLNKLLAAKC